MFFPVRPNAIKNRKTKSPSTSESQSPSSAKRASQGQQGRTSRTSTKETKSSERTAHSSTSSLPHRAPLRRSSMPGLPDTASQADTASFLESRTSLPYPTFSKAHSKEDVRHRDIPTPDPTDLTAQKENGRSQDRAEHHHAPPSPPLTGLDQESSQRGSATSKQDEKEGEKPKVKRGSIRIRTTEVNRSSSSLRSKKDDSTKRADSTRSSKTTTRSDTPRSKASRSDKENLSPRMTHQPSKSKLSDERKLPKRSSRSTMSPSQSTVRDAGTESMNGSDATSIAPNQQYNPPRKLTSPPAKPPSRNQTRSAASHRHTPSDDSIDYGRPMMPGPGYGAPPPPPPPPQMPITVPRVDYLLQHGGLDHRVPRTLLPVPAASDPFAHSAAQPQRAAADVFEPFSRLLDDYQKVMSKNGSLAVATGYRSVARRLLDRLEAVFARDISSEPCNCTMCDHNDTEERPEGVSWGEVLELVSGRRELPMWPPFTMAASNVDAEIPDEEHIPMQKLDVDVPEEYRDHFIRQSRKTKVAVDKWLSEQTDSASSAPEEVDDETLTFAMLTYLEPHQRSVFCALLGINSSTPVPRSDDEKPRHRPSPLISSSQAIQRLYRLRTLPRDPETAMFMLNHPDLHHVLATLAAITDDEWEILISGRFDGFLRSGIEDPVSSPNPRWSGSRSNTPFSGAGVSRGPTPNYMDGSFRPASQATGGPSSPASFGGPIALDEETEIAALAEIERDIFRGMEALEDAFEALHLKAEVVRLALRERGAGLSVANQNRRGSYVEARLGTPASGVHAWESGTEDDFLDDDRSLAPDDSASNISSNRRRRPKRRTERRTPAPVEEEEEDEDLAQVHRRESRNSRRR